MSGAAIEAEDEMCRMAWGLGWIRGGGVDVTARGGAVGGCVLSMPWPACPRGAGSDFG